MNLETKQYLSGQIQRLTKRLGIMSHRAPWASMTLYLMQIPGFGVVTTMTVLAVIGDISRFETPKYLVSSAGLAPGVEQSGTKKRSKPITKEGRKELRWATLAPHASAGVVEVARRAVSADPVWKRRFEELKRRKQPNDAYTVTLAPHCKCRCRSSTLDRRLASAHSASTLQTLLPRAYRLQIPDLVLATR